MEHAESELLLENTLEIASLMVQCGAEARRVESTVIHIMDAYGYEVQCANAVTSMVNVSVKSPEGWHYSQSIRVLRCGTNLGLLERLNALARRISQDPPPVDSLKDMIQAEQQVSYPAWAEFLGYLFGAFAFSAFFGGDLMDAFSAAIIAVVVFGMDRLMNHRIDATQNRLLYTFIASFLAGDLALLLCKSGLGHDVSFIMIGDSMLFMPGLALVNGVRELFYRDIITGVCRIVEALMLSVAIAAGFGTAFVLLGGIL